MPATRTIAALAASAAGLLLSAAAPHAAAQCSIFREGVPDFDQERTALPGGGSMYCVPTSASDFLAYISNNGLPQVYGGPFNWQLPQYYDYVTGQIDHLGDLMKTSATGGTSGGNGEDGLEDLLWDRAPYLFTVSTYYGYVRLPDVYNFMADNRLVLLCYGYYRANDQGIFSRNGGHCIALTGMLNACSTSPVIRFRDPADDGNGASQSAFSSRVSNASLLSFSMSGGPVTRWWLRSLGSPGSSLRMIDRHITIRPRFAIYPSAINGSFVRHDLLNSIRAQGPTLTAFSTPNGRPVQSGVLSPSGDFFYHLTSESDFDFVMPIHRQNMLTGASERLVTLDGGTPLAMDRFGDLYLYRFGRTRRYDVSGAGMVEMGSFAPIDNRPPDALVWDDTRDQLVAVSPGRLQLLNRAMVGVGNYTLPTGVVTAGQLRVDVTAMGTYVIGSTESPTLYHVRHDFVQPRLVLMQTISAGAGVTGVRAIQASEGGVGAAAVGGRLCVMTNAGVREFTRNPTTFVWEPAADPRFAGAPVSNVLIVSKGRTNFDPAQHSGPGWEDVLVPEPGPTVPDCPGDLNWDGVVEVGDIFVFLRWYFANERAADFDVSGDVAIADIFAYLGAFFAGCG